MSYNLELKIKLEERTTQFGENVIKLCKEVTLDAISRPIVGQLVRSGTSIGANYAEATNACSKKDFRNKLYIAKKEAQETLHWFKILKAHSNKNSNFIDELQQECHEFVLIFQKALSTLQNR